jgi:hypothetical protein
MCCNTLLLADETIILHNDNSKKASLGVLPFIVGDELRIGQFRNLPVEEQQHKTKELLDKYFINNIQNFSSFNQVSSCTSSTQLLVKKELTVKGKKVTFNVPAESIRETNGRNNTYYLLVEIPFIFDDSSSITINTDFFAGISLSPIKGKPEEECINFGCKFLFWNNAKKYISCYGVITAEGCGLRSQRYGNGGGWATSISDLVNQIFEDTPFKMKTLDASDFH